MISTATIKGPRSQNEDRFVVATLPDGVLLAVMDGHGGVDVAKYLARRLPAAWAEPYPELDIANKMRRVVANLHEETRASDTGSTISMVFISMTETVAYVAILGDSPVIVRQPNGTLHISPDHNVRTNQAEEHAAMARGAFIVGGYMCAHYDGPGLQMTRALGDWELDSVIDRTPEVYSVPLGEWVLLASDGLFDPAHKISVEEQVHEFALSIDVGATAQDLVNSVRVPRDNITAILWKRRPRARIDLNLGNVFTRPNRSLGPATI